MQFSKLPQRIIRKIKEIERKIVSYPIENKLFRLKEKLDDKKLNRELIVVDKYGNRYYQMYSNEGIPSKRYVHLHYKALHKWDEDPTMQSWLQGRREIAPSQEELEKIYIKQEELERRGLEWDKKEAKLIEEYRKKHTAAIEQEHKETGASGEGEKFLPGKWENALTNLEESQIALIENAIANLPKWDVSEYENLYGLKGKYMMDFEKDNLEYDTKKYMQMNEHYFKALAKIDVNNYTPEKMSEKCNKQLEEQINKLKSEFQELTNTGKRMLEKKEKFKRYNKFRGIYNDVFEAIKL